MVSLLSRTISHARGHLRVSRCARRTTEKRETACSLDMNCRQPEARMGNVPWPGNSMDGNLIMRKNIVMRDF